MKRRGGSGVRLVVAALAIIVALVILSGCQGKAPADSVTQGQAKESEVPVQESSDNTTPVTDKAADTGSGGIGENVYSHPQLGFSFEYNQLMLDDKMDGDVYATLMHLSGDKAEITVAKPNDILEDPEAWLKKTGTTKDYKTYVDKVMTLNGYPARLNEYEVTMMGTLYRHILLTVFKDGYFYKLSILMNAAYVEDVRTEFDVVVKTFNVTQDKVDLEALALWQQALPDNFPKEAVPLFEVAEIYGVNDFGLAEKGALVVEYVLKPEVTPEAVLEFYDALLKGSEGYVKEKRRQGQVIEGSVKGYSLEVVVGDYLGDMHVTIDIKRKP